MITKYDVGYCWVATCDVIGEFYHITSFDSLKKAKKYRTERQRMSDKSYKFTGVYKQWMIFKYERVY